MDLHDATFQNVCVSWAERVADITFVTRDGPMTVRAGGLSAFAMTLEHAWGPSESVNGMVGPEALPDGDYRWVIEMQSGDRIDITAQELGSASAS